MYKKYSHIIKLSIEANLKREIIHKLKAFSLLMINFEIINQRREGFARDGIFISSLDKALF